VPLEEQELHTLPEHLSSPPVFSGVRVTRSLVLYVCFVDRCLSFCTFSFGHCVVCSSSNGQPRHGGDRKIFEMMTSTLSKGTLGSVASLLATTLYQGNPDRSHKLWNIASSEKYILHMQVLLEAPESIPILVVFVNHCSSFFLFLLAIVLSVLLRFMASDYPFGIFKLFLKQCYNNKLTLC
jgi:hypothetical protein